MSFTVQLLLRIPCAGPKSVPIAAAAFLAQFQATAATVAPGSTQAWEDATGLLTHLATGGGFASWSRGSTFTWGVGGNRTDVASFVETLQPFWQELLRCRTQVEEHDWDGPYNVSNILLLHEAEADGHASAVKIRNADPWRVNRHPPLAVEHYALPISLYSTKSD